jgi:hypothetical protein
MLTKMQTIYSKVPCKRRIAAGRQKKCSRKSRFNCSMVGICHERLIVHTYASLLPKGPFFTIGGKSKRKVRLKTEIDLSVPHSSLLLSMIPVYTVCDVRGGVWSWWMCSVNACAQILRKWAKVTVIEGNSPSAIALNKNQYIPKS